MSITSNPELLWGIVGAIAIRVSPLLVTFVESHQNRGRLSRLLCGLSAAVAALAMGVQDIELIISAGVAGSTLSKGAYDGVKGSKTLERVESALSRKKPPTAPVVEDDFDFGLIEALGSGR